MRDHRDELLAMIRSIAAATTMAEFESRVAYLKESALWKSENSKALRNWIEKTWLPVHKVSSENC